MSKKEDHIVVTSPTPSDTEPLLRIAVEHWQVKNGSPATSQDERNISHTLERLIRSRSHDGSVISIAVGRRGMHAAIAHPPDINPGKWETVRLMGHRESPAEQTAGDTAIRALTVPRTEGP